MRYIYIISIILLLALEVLLNNNTYKISSIIFAQSKINLLVVIDYIQDVLVLLFSILLSKNIFAKTKKQKDPLNASNIQEELLVKENKQLQQKIKTLEIALDNNI